MAENSDRIIYIVFDQLCKDKLNGGGGGGKHHKQKGDNCEEANMIMKSKSSLIHHFNQFDFL